MRSFAIVVMLVIGPLAACASDGAESADAIVDTCGAALSVDSPPIWDESSPGQVVLVEEHPFYLVQTATDPWGNGVTYLLKQRADDGMTIDEDTGEIRWTPGFDAVRACGETASFDVHVTARTTRDICGQVEFVDVGRTFTILVLNDEDEDGTADVDENNARVDHDADGDGLDFMQEDALGTDDCLVDSDEDGVADPDDNCPLEPNPPRDCDADPSTPDAQCDADGDGVGDGCQT